MSGPDLTTLVSVRIALGLFLAGLLFRYLVVLDHRTPRFEQRAPAV